MLRTGETAGAVSTGQPGTEQCDQTLGVASDDEQWKRAYAARLVTTAFVVGKNSATVTH